MSIGGMMRLAGIETVDVVDIAPGWVVRHGGTKMLGIVLEVVPQFDKTKELRVMPWPSDLWFEGGHPRWWATYHLSDAMSINEVAALAEHHAERGCHLCRHTDEYQRPCRGAFRTSGLLLAARAASESARAEK